MIIIVSIIAVLMFISIYLFYRAEIIQKQLKISQKENKRAKKQNEDLIDAMLVSANKYEEFAKFRLQEIKQVLNNHKENAALFEEFELINLFVQNYAAIYCECLKGEHTFKVIMKKVFDTQNSNAFEQFTQYMTNQEATLRKMWSSDSLNGFISLNEALILKLQKQINSH